MDASPLISFILDRWYSRGAEVGVFRGNSSQVLANLPTMRRLFLVDSWEPYTVHTQNGLVEMTQVRVNDQYLLVYNLFYDNPRVEIVRKRSVDAARVIPKDLDFVFLDAGYTYESAKADIVAWKGHIRPGGILCGDDYHLFRDGEYGVRRAVDEAFEGPLSGRVHLLDTLTHVDGFYQCPPYRNFVNRFWYVEYKDLWEAVDVVGI